MGGAVAAIGIDAVSYLVSVISLASIGTRDAAHAGPPLSVAQGVREIVEGFGAIAASPNLRWITAATATTNFGNFHVGAVSLVYAYRILLSNRDRSAWHMAWARSASSVRFFRYASARVSAYGRRCSVRSSSRGSVPRVCWQPNSDYPTLALFASSAIVAISVPIYNVNQVSYRQAIIDVRLQGRINATIRTFVWGTLPLGALAGGYVASLAGTRTNDCPRRSRFEPRGAVVTSDSRGCLARRRRRNRRAARRFAQRAWYVNDPARHSQTLPSSITKVSQPATSGLKPSLTAFVLPTSTFASLRAAARAFVYEN